MITIFYNSATSINKNNISNFNKHIPIAYLLWAEYLLNTFLRVRSVFDRRFRNETSEIVDFILILIEYHERP